MPLEMKPSPEEKADVPTTIHSKIEDVMTYFQILHEFGADCKESRERMRNRVGCLLTAYLGGLKRGNLSRNVDHFVV